MMMMIIFVAIVKMKIMLMRRMMIFVAIVKMEMMLMTRMMMMIVIMINLNSMYTYIFIYIIIYILEYDIDDKEIKFDAFRGKVVYIVNVASYW